MGRPSSGCFANTTQVGQIVGLSSKDVEKTVDAMLDSGHRYKNMEIALGKGICLTLGCDLSESYWTKLMKKSGRSFDLVVKHLRTTDAVRMSVQYASLCERIARDKMERIQDIRPSSCIALSPNNWDPTLTSPWSPYQEAEFALRA